ncbi:multicopper oxidase family protein [Amycolatopsis aidingensis]|uniref:multicopper oxidase family protein n=1 Tax=Amycolatopsis aidingensis TaxID=2842453 RepID=UPI001E32EF55|nr:multicopper oxidase domain-containing protein [Amycolatopsis aidingensis]
MPLSRKEFLKLAGTITVAAAVNTACSNDDQFDGSDFPADGGGGDTGDTAGEVVPSEAPIPPAFQARLPVPPVLSPTRTDATTDYYEITQRTAQAEILPGLQTTVWGYNGIFPGPTIEARSGRKVVVRQRNELSLPIAVHLHGGVTPPDSDGYPTDLVLPADGSFTAADVVAPDPTLSQGDKEYVYPLNQRAMTLWYHDHRMDFTGPQIYYGLAGFFILRDDEEDALPLPKGEREIPLMIADRSFNADGSFRYPALDPSLRGEHGVQGQFMTGVLGDVILVNGAPWPVLEVSNTRYRLRMLNASNTREYDLRLESDRGEGSFVQVGSDGGLLAGPVTHRNIKMAPAERFDVVVDFSQFPVGSQVVLRNARSSGRTAEVMRFDVVREEPDDSSVPDTLSTTLDLPDPAQAVATRRFDFFQLGEGDWSINGQLFDPDTILARPARGTTEIWEFSSDINHPVHVHLGHFRIFERGDTGDPRPWDVGLKDTVQLDPNGWARVAIRFTEFTGKYILHCHNLEHEDMGMMGNFEVT